MNATFLETAAPWLLRVSAEGGGLILVVLACRRMMGRYLSPAWRVGLWSLVALKLVIPACLPTGFGIGLWGGSVSMTSREGKEAVPLPTLVGTQAPQQGPRMMATESAVPSPRVPWWGVLWVIGGMTVLGSALWKQAQFKAQLAHLAEAHDPDLLAEVAAVCRQAGWHAPMRVLLTWPGSTPGMTGITSPQLLLPSDWRRWLQEGSLRHVLLHEILHARHRDVFWNWVALALQALHWFNPLVWVAVSRFQADRELVCDAAVLQRLPPTERTAYGHTLIRLQEHLSAPPVIAGLAPCVRNHPALLQRITMIARPTSNRPWTQAVYAVAFSLILCYAFGSAAAAEGEGKRPTEGDRDGDSIEAKAVRDGDTRGPRERDGSRPKNGPHDVGKQKGAHDRADGKSGPPDGNKAKTGIADGAERKGPRDGGRPKQGPRDIGLPKEEQANEASLVSVHVSRESVRINGDDVPMNRLRGYLHHELAEQQGRVVSLTAEPDVKPETLNAVVDALRDNRFRNIRREGARE